MKWILIFWMGGGYGGGPATAEFGSEAACQHALSILDIWSRTAKGICVPSGGAGDGSPE